MVMGGEVVGSLASGVRALVVSGCFRRAGKLVMARLSGSLLGSWLLPSQEDS